MFNRNRSKPQIGSTGDVITDDNQMLAYGWVRAHSRLYDGPKGTARRNLKPAACIESLVHL